MEYNGWTIYTGCDFVAAFGLQSTDITDYSARFLVRSQDGTTLYDLPDDGTITNDGDLFKATIPAASTADATPQVCEFVIVITDTDGLILRRLGGSIPIERAL